VSREREINFPLIVEQVRIWRENLSLYNSAKDDGQQDHALRSITVAFRAIEKLDPFHTGYPQYFVLRSAVKRMESHHTWYYHLCDHEISDILSSSEIFLSAVETGPPPDVRPMGILDKALYGVLPSRLAEWWGTKIPVEKASTGVPSPPFEQTRESQNSWATVNYSVRNLDRANRSRDAYKVVQALNELIYDLQLVRAVESERIKGIQVRNMGTFYEIINKLRQYERGDTITEEESVALTRYLELVDSALQGKPLPTIVDLYEQARYSPPPVTVKQEPEPRQEESREVTAQQAKQGERIPLVKRTEPSSVIISDADVVAVAKKYAGIVPKIAVVDELKISLEEAGLLLEKFVTDGEARRVTVGSLTIYDFPGVRRYLGKLPNILIEAFLEEGGPLPRANLVRIAGVSLDALDEALKDLGREGIVTKNPSTDSYALRIAQQDINEAASNIRGQR